MGKIDWKNRNRWNSLFDTEITRSPFQERARREWALFHDSKIAKMLSDPDLVVQVEVPFLCSLPDDRCVEGFIDLAAYDPERNEWLVLDWKTNEIEESHLDELRCIYQPQLQQYAEAVQTVLGTPTSVKSAIYSTAAGKLIYL